MVISAVVFSSSGICSNVSIAVVAVVSTSGLSTFSCGSPVGTGLSGMTVASSVSGSVIGTPIASMVTSVECGAGPLEMHAARISSVVSAHTVTVFLKVSCSNDTLLSVA